MSNLTYEMHENVAVVTMDDGKANALSEQMIDALIEALDRAQKEAAAVVVAGRPDRFCAGFDLKVMMTGPEEAKALLRRGAGLLMKLYGLPMPVVVACTGHAVAGGALMLLTGDVRIGAAGAYRIGLNEVEIGLPVPVLAMELARDRLRVVELARATLHARIYAPDAAMQAGWLDEVVAPGEVIARAKAEAARLGAFARFPYAATKQRLRGRTIEHIVSTLDEDMKTITAGS
jgi:enoyl-CoA hydratase